MAGDKKHEMFGYAWPADSGNGREETMSEAQVKATPSKAAMELVRVILSPLRLPITEEQYRDAAAVVDEKLAELLKTSQTLNFYIEARWGDSDATIQGLNRPLSSALEPWKSK